MRSRRTALPFALTVAFLLLGAGCARQDLYEPPGAPFVRVGSVALPSENEGVAIMGRYAFVAGGQAGLHTIDFSDPSNPRLVQTINTLKYSESVEVVRTFVDHQLQDIALVVEGTEGITSYDITDPAAVTSFNSGTTAVFGNRVFVDEPADPEEPYVCYLAESWKGVRIFESIPAQAGILAYNGVFVGTNGYAEGIVVRDGFAYVADDEMGLAVLDVRVLDLDSVGLASWADSPGEALDVELQGDHAYVADGPDGLAVFRIDGGETPVLVASLALDGKCRAVAVRDDLCVLAAQGGGVHFVDVFDPANPVFLGRILTGYAMDLAISSEGFVLAIDRDQGLVIMQGPEAFRDETAPAAVRSLTAESFGVGAVRLSWYATGDDRLEGQAAALEIRYADAAITDEAAWQAATAVPDVPTPEAPGAAMSFVATELSAGMHYFSVRCRDEADHMSDLGNTAGAQPGDGILLTDASLDLLGGTTSDNYTYAVTYVYPEAPQTAEVLIDGTAYAMSEAGGTAGETRYTYQTTLPAGEHTYAFHFVVADPEVPAATTAAAQGPVVGRLVFAMGSNATTDPLDPAFEPGRRTDEWQHTVVLSHDLQAEDHEVTQAEWAALGLGDPSGFDGADRPVESVTWLQAVAYCNSRSSDDGFDPAYTIAGNEVTWDQAADGWRLPTEAEWEWLCRGNSATTLATGPLVGRVCNLDPVLDSLGWYCGNAVSGTSDVSQKAANGFGLHDLHGNVWEWCWDWYGDYRLADANGDGVVLDPQGPAVGSQRIVRGGSWYGGSEDCRSARRAARYPDSAEDVVGLRVVRTLFSK